ncbi:MAG: EpsG family protein [Elusimicrobiaceae bacterium]
MSFYIIIFFLLLLLSISAPKNKVIFILCIIALTALAGFRGINIGADTHAYYDYFRSFYKGYSGHMEPLWNCLNFVIAHIGLNFNVFLLLVSAFTLGPIAFVLWKELKNPQFGLFLYYALYAYCNSFNGMRQYLAISWVCLSFYFLYHNKNYKFFITILLSTLIHYSAIIGLIVFPFKYFNLKNILVYSSLIITLVLGMTIFPKLNLQFLYGHYASYMESSYWIRESVLQTAFLAVLMNIYFICITFTANQKIKNGYYYKILFVGLLIMNLTVQIEMFARIILYFTIIQVLFVPQYLKSMFLSPIQKLFFNLIFLAYFSAIFFKILILGNGGIYSIYPYTTMIYPL